MGFRSKWVGNLPLFLALSLLAVALICGLLDTLIVFGKLPMPTVSQIIQGWATEQPIIGVAIGVLIGHLFWPVKYGDGKEKLP